MEQPRTMLLLDPSVVPHSWNERMAPGEYAVLYSSHESSRRTFRVRLTALSSRLLQRQRCTRIKRSNGRTRCVVESMVPPGWEAIPYAKFAVPHTVGRVRCRRAFVGGVAAFCSSVVSGLSCSTGHLTSGSRGQLQWGPEPCPSAWSFCSQKRSSSTEIVVKPTVGRCLRYEGA
jgi:hypothetical protein